MTEVIPPDMYDAIQSSPVSLQELSAVAITLEIWHCERHKFRKSPTKFRPYREYLSLETILPRLPVVIYNVIEEYVMRFGLSMDDWLASHLSRVFRSRYRHQNCILEDFDDFVCNYNGTIHYVRTAQRMMGCDRFTLDDKFSIACTYFFEHDIDELWPSVSKNMNLDNINFSTCPQLYYWICRLNNDLQGIPRPRNVSIDEQMFGQCMFYNGPSVEYFWYRMPYEYRFRSAVHLYKLNKESFVRFILPKLNNQLLDRFVNDEGNDLMRDLLRDRYFDERFVLHTWMYVNDVMSQINFTKMVVEMLETESGLQSTNENRKLKSFLCLCCEIWSSQSSDFQQRTIGYISSNSKFFIHNRCYTGHSTSSKFLLFILSSASFEARSLFWQRWWSHLIVSKDIQDLDQMMKICFQSENEITLFKENFIAKSETLYDLCLSLLHGPYWDKLNNLVDFCCPDMETARHFKQQLLRVNLLSENTRFWYAYIGKTEEFNDFVNDAFNNADLAAEFKNQLMSSPVIQYRLSRSVRSSIALSINLIKFIETFVSNEEIMRQIKTCIIGHLKEDAIANSSTVKNEYVKPSFVEFLLWCLGSEEEVTKFKQVYILPFIR